MTEKWRKLRNKILNEQDTTLYDEVIKCFEVKAYRMAYIAVWISIAESLKNKFKKMAQKDPVVDGVVKRIGELEQGHSPPDRYILDKAKELGILDEIAFQQIEPIFKMRNLFAHPYHIAPTRDEVVSAIRVTVEKVLSLPPLLRKPYIDNLLDNLGGNRHFLDDLEEKVKHFAEDIILRISPDLHPYLIKGLFYHLNEVIDDPDKYIFLRRLVWFTRTCIHQIKPDFSNPEWRLEAKFNDFPQAVSLVFTIPELWSHIPGKIQDSIVSYLLYPEKEGKIVMPTIWETKLVFKLAKNKKLSKRQNERFNKRLDGFTPDKLIEIGIPIESCIEDIKNRFIDYNYYIQNPAADAIKLAGYNGIRDLKNGDLECLGRNVLQSAEGGARSSISLINDILRSDHKWPKSFVKGILFECFVNEKHQFRCKNSCLKEAILLTIRNCESESLGIFKSLVKEINKSNTIDSLSDNDVEESMQEIEASLEMLTPEERRAYSQILSGLKGAVSEKQPFLPF